jgi:putative methionine-R-sulfoxide reductase with GAF domain
LLQEHKLWGVLDVDSPQLERFDDEDRRGLKAAATLLVQASDFSILL